MYENKHLYMLSCNYFIDNIKIDINWKLKTSITEIIYFIHLHNLVL